MRPAHSGTAHAKNRGAAAAQNTKFENFQLSKRSFKNPRVCDKALTQAIGEA
jgi:hypothetical protein